MNELTTTDTIMTINIQVSDFESESISVHCITEVDARVEHFCKIYRIANPSAVRALKIKIRNCLQEKYPFLACRDEKKGAAKRKVTKKAGSMRDALVAPRAGARKPIVENSVNRVGIKSLLYNKKPAGVVGANAANPRSRGAKLVKSFVEPVPQRVFIKNKVGEEKENAADRRISAKPNLNIDLSLSNIVSREAPVALLYGGTNPLLSYSYTNPTVMHQRVVPQTTTNKSFACRNAENESEHEMRRLSSNQSMAKLTKKSSFYEYSTQYDTRNSRLQESQLRLREVSIGRPMIDDPSELGLNFDNYAFKVMPKEQLKSVFDSLDGANSGLIGPKNLNLRSLSADHLKLLEGVVIEIFKSEQNAFFTFNDFCKLVKEHIRLE